LIIEDKPMDTNEVMTLAEVAKYLQLAEKTVLRMVKRGEIPAAKVASQWRFMRAVIRDWLITQMQTLPWSDLESRAFREKTILPFSEVMRPELVALNILPGPKESILKQLTVPLENTGFARDCPMLLQSLIERERMMTTAAGHGMAVPHPRKPLPKMFAEPAIVLGVCPKGTNFDAIDDQLVHLFFLICATREEIHLQLMARVSLLTRHENVMLELQQTSTKQQAANVIKKITKLD